MEIDWSGERYHTVVPLQSAGRRTSQSAQRTIECLRIELESCRQKNEDLEMRAVSAEMEATHQNLEMNNLMDKVALREATICKLERELEQSRQRASNSEKTLERFQRKINRLRVALTREIERIKQTENEAKTNFNLLFHSVVQYRTNEISKEQFLSAVAELESTFPSPSPSPVTPPRVPQTSDLPSDEKERPKHDGCHLSTDSDANTPLMKHRKSQLNSLVGMLTEQGMYASTDDELLDGAKNSKAGKRLHQSKQANKNMHVTTSRGDQKLVTHQPLEVSSSAAALESSSSDAGRHGSMKSRKSSGSDGITRKSSSSFRSMKNFPFLDKRRGKLEKKWETDSDNSDFEIFIPPPKKNSKELSGNWSMLQKLAAKSVGSAAVQKDANLRTDAPDSHADCSTFPRKAPLKKFSSMKKGDSSASVASSKGTSKRRPTSPNTKRALFVKSVSSDSFYYDSVKDEEVYETLSEGDPARSVSEPDVSSNNSGDDDCTGGTVVDFSQMVNHRRMKIPAGESSLFTLTQELIKSTRADEDFRHDYNSDEGCTYLDPKELESQPTATLRRSSNMHVPVLDEEVSSTYLTLLEINQIGQQSATNGPKLAMDVSSKGLQHSTKEPYTQEHDSFTHNAVKTGSNLNVSILQEKWRAESSCASGYSTDSSSNWDADMGGDLDRPALDFSGSKLLPLSSQVESTSNLDFAANGSRKTELRRRKTSLSCPGDFGEGDIYAEIDDFDVDVDGSDEREESDYIPSEKYVSLFKKSPTHSVSSSTTVGAVHADSPLVSALVSSETGSQDLMYESMYAPGIKGNSVKTIPHFPPSLPPRSRKIHSRGMERANTVVKRYSSVPQVKSSGKDTAQEKPEATHFGTPVHSRRPQAGSNHSFSPLVKQSRANNASMGSQNDLIGAESQHKAHRSGSNPSGNPSKTLSVKTQAEEKVGFLRKMDSKMKWNRRWFVLKGVELRYFKTNKKSLKGVIHLDRWCRLNNGSSPDSFQLETEKKVYYLGCSSEKERNEWVEAIEATMQLQLPQSSSAAEETHSAVTMSGWAHVKRNKSSQRQWCVLKGSVLFISQNSDSEPVHQVKVSESVIHRKRDSIVLDSVQVLSDFLSVLFPLQDSCGITEIQPEEQANKDSWYSSLCSTQMDQMDVQQTPTENLLDEIEQSNCPLTHKHWAHPVFSVTTGQFSAPLTSIRSAPVTDSAKTLLQNMQTFISSQILADPSRDFSFHVCLMQDIIGTCLDHMALQDEAYCLVLRDITGHLAAVSWQLAQGWLLLSLMLSSFLPVRPLIFWYLQTFLNRQSSSHRPAISSHALSCQDILSTALELGQRRMKPSFFELCKLMEKFSETGSTLEYEISIPVHLEDGSSVEVEFNQFTSIRDLVTLVNTRTALSESHVTGFGIFSDWPGVDSMVCCCPFLDTKMVDLIAVWFAALDNLSNCPDSSKPSKYQRTIQLSYKKCQFLKFRSGYETPKEAVLLAYQLSKSIHSGELPVPSTDNSIAMAAFLAQMEYGDRTLVTQQQRKKLGESDQDVARDAVLLFCPWKMTHLALDHDLALIQKKLEDYWKGLAGMAQEGCAQQYVKMVQDLDRYGITSFQAEEYTAGSRPQRPVQLAVSERGVVIYNIAGTSVLSSYKYEDISTFGGSSDTTFMLIVSSLATPPDQLKNNPKVKKTSVSQRTVEKLTYAMHKLKVCEVTYLISSYIEANKSTPQWMEETYI